ncbi:ABC transporter permease, partial [Arsukibacterium sp.]|uniref:ABC transporter permease n=1 Tax=Arsukibacterium sp. TaxID=1977258 RepID=UPI002FD98ADA
MLYLHALTFGLKRLYLQPRLCLPVIVSLGLSLAAVLVVLTLCYTILIQPLPQVRQAEQLTVQQVNLQFGSIDVGFIDKHRFVSLQRQFASYGDWGFLTSSTQDSVEANATRFSATVFFSSNNTPQLLGIALINGHAPAQADAEQAVWISESLWQNRFNRSADVVGKSLTLQNKTYSIAGVMPDFYAAADNHQFSAEQVWQVFDPATTAPLSESTRFGSKASIILRSDGALPSDAELAQWLENEKQQAPRALAPMFQRASFKTSQQGYRQYLLADSQKLLWLLLAVTTGLFSIAALNLTNVLLAHYQGRHHEFAVQTVSGCRSSTLRLLIALENVSLILPAILLALLAAQWLFRLIPTLAGDAIPLAQSVTLNGITLLSAAALGAILLWLFSLPVSSSENGLTTKLNQSGKGSSKQQKALLIKCLLLLQLTIASVLITSTAALAWHSYKEIFTGWGFNMVNSYQIRLQKDQQFTVLSDSGDSSTAEQRVSRYRQHRLQLQQALQQHWPQATVLDSDNQPISDAFTIGTLKSAADAPNIEHTVAVVEPRHFATFGIALLHGRSFSADEDPRAIIVDLNFASLLHPTDPAQAVGQTLYANNKTQQIIGIAANVKTSRKPLPHVYSPPNARNPVIDWQQLVLVLPKQQLITEADVSLALAELATGYNIKLFPLQQLWQDLTRQSRIYFYLICLISATTLLLALLGTAGVSQMRAQQRRYELAVRMAIGASQQNLLW